MFLRLCVADIASSVQAVSGTQLSGPTPPIPLRTTQSLNNAEQPTGGVAGTTHGPATFTKTALLDAPTIIPGYAPLTGSSDVSQNVAANVLPHVPPLSTAPDHSLVVPSIDTPVASEHVPPNDPLNVPPIVLSSTPAPALCPDSPPCTVPSTNPHQTQLTSSSAVPSPAPARPIVQFDVPLTVPSPGGVTGPHPASSSLTVSSACSLTSQPVVPTSVSPSSLSSPPAAATPTHEYLAIASEGLKKLSSPTQPASDLLPGQQLDTSWSFPPDYRPTFPSHDLSAVPPGAFVNDSWNVQPDADSAARDNSDWNVMSSDTGTEALTMDLASADDAWDLSGPQLYADSDAVNEDTELDNDLKTVGRVSETNLAIIKAEFIEVQQRAKAVAEKTGMSPAQVLEYWNTAAARTHSKRNMWNLYSSYFREYEEQELSRLSERKSTTLSREVLILTLLLL